MINHIDSRVDKIEKAIESCPTIYNIYLKDGKFIYLRYRYGVWRMSLFESYVSPEQYAEQWPTAPVISRVISDDMHSSLDYEQAVDIINNNIDKLLDVRSEPGNSA